MVDVLEKEGERKDGESLRWSMMGRPRGAI